MTRSPVMVALSGGVDSSMAAALLVDAGHEVVGVTMKLWGGTSDTGCCSVSDVDDARRVAHRLGIEHHVFNFGDEFERDVVAPYAADHAAGRTPNPCIECNRKLKFDKLLRRAEALGFDQVATGHHARRAVDGDGRWRVGRGTDQAKDQSYVLHTLGQAELAMTLFPLGELTKAEVRDRAASLGLPTATKPDSQDVCFITRADGRRAFLDDRIELHPAPVVDRDGVQVGVTDAVELVTIGQRKGLELAGGAGRRFVVDVDVPGRRVVVGDEGDLLCDSVELHQVVGAYRSVRGDVLVQCSAHGDAVQATFDGTTVRWAQPHRRVAAGQSVVIYQGDLVAAGGLAR
jgi:tRNA-specific 2-thiouridylase